MEGGEGERSHGRIETTVYDSLQRRGLRKEHGQMVGFYFRFAVFEIEMERAVRVLHAKQRRQKHPTMGTL